MGDSGGLAAVKDRPLPKPVPKPIPAPPKPEPPKQLTAEELEKMGKTVKAVIAELIETERSYLNGLLKIFTEYEAPMRELKSKRVRKTNLVSTLLAVEVVKSIMALSQTMFARLKDLTDPAEVAQVFVSCQKEFEVYKSYVVTYSESMELMEKLVKTKPKIAQFLENARSRCAGLGLDSLMITPIQRIPRYILLLREIQKNINPSDQKTHGQMEAAMKAMQEVADGINEAKRQEEKYQELIEIESKLVRCPLPSELFTVRKRFHITTFTDCEWVSTDKQKLINCQIMVFTDIMLITDPPDEQSRLLCHSCWFYKDIKLAFPTDQISWGLHPKIYRRLGSAVYIQTPFGIETFITSSGTARTNMNQQLSQLGLS